MEMKKHASIVRVFLSIDSPSLIECKILLQQVLPNPTPGTTETGDLKGCLLLLSQNIPFIWAMQLPKHLALACLPIVQET